MVKRNLIHSLSALLLLTVFLASCSKKEAYTNVIPADAGLVVSVDVKSMVDKSGLDDKGNESMIQNFLGSLKADLNPASYQQIEKIMKNPEESGLSVNDRIYFFSTVKNLALVVKVADEAKLKGTLKLLEEQKVGTAIESGDGFSWMSLEGNTLCAFNKDVLLILSSFNSSGIESLKAEAKILMTQKEANSIRSNKGFNKIDDRKEDITAYLSLAGMPNMDMVKSAANLPAGVDLKELMILASLNFEKGRIVAKAEMFTENKELKKMLDEQAALNKPTGEFFDFFPASTLLFLNYSLNGEKLYEMLAANPEFSEAVKNQEMGIDVKKLLSSFDGDITAGVTGFTGFGIPTIVAYAKVNGNYLLELLTAQKQMIETTLGTALVATGKDAYVLNYQGMDFFIGMTGNFLYLTNDRATLTRLNNKVSDPMTDVAWASEVKKSPAFFAINIAEIMKNPLLSAFASSGDPQMAMIMTALGGCSYVKVFEASKGVGEMDIVLKNQNENVLKQIVTGMKEMTGK